MPPTAARRDGRMRLALSGGVGSGQAGVSFKVAGGLTEVNPTFKLEHRRRSPAQMIRVPAERDRVRDRDRGRGGVPDTVTVLSGPAPGPGPMRRGRGSLTVTQALRVPIRLGIKASWQS